MDDASKKNELEKEPQTQATQAQDSEPSEEKVDVQRKDYVWSVPTAVKVNMITIMLTLITVTSIVVMPGQTDWALEIRLVWMVANAVLGGSWAYLWWRLIAPNLTAARRMWRVSLGGWLLFGLMMPLILSIMLSMSSEGITDYVLLAYMLGGGHIGGEFLLAWLRYRSKARNGQGFFEYCNTERKIKRI